MTETPGIAVGADVAGEFLVAIGSVKKQLQLLRQENHEAQRQAQYAAIKNYLPFTGAVTLGATGVGFYDFGTPDFGRVWTVRFLSAAIQGGELATSAVANVAWYIGANIPGSGAGTAQQFTSQWREATNSVPFRITYTSTIHQARFGDHLFVVVNGGAGALNANMVFNAVVEDEPMKVGVPTAAHN